MKLGFPNDCDGTSLFPNYPREFEVGKFSDIWVTPCTSLNYDVIGPLGILDFFYKVSSLIIGPFRIFSWLSLSNDDLAWWFYKSSDAISLKLV